MRSVLAILLLLIACYPAPPEPTPDLQPTVEALVNQRLAEKERKAIIDAAVQRQLEAIQATLTPTPTATATPIPEPTATPAPTYTPRPTPTVPPRPTATPEIGHINWIDKEIFSTGLPPMIPDWLRPFVFGPADPYTINAVQRGTLQLPKPPPGTILRLPTRAWPGQELLLISPEAWCDFSPTQRLMVLEYIVWLGSNISDWLDRQSGIRAAWDRCPPAASY